MSLKIFRQTLLDRWKSISLLTVLFFVYMAYFTSVYPSTASLSEANINEMLNNPAIKLLLGNLQFDNSFESYLSTKALMFAGLILGGFTAWLTAGFLSGEIDHKTIDILLAQPVRRGRIVLARYAALVLVIAVIMLAALAGLLVAVLALDIETSVPWLAYAMGYMGLMTLSFGAIALFVSACMSDGRRAALTSLGILVVMYFMETLGSVVDLLGPIRYLSLFHYARYNAMLMSKTLSLTDIGVMLAVAIVFVALAACMFRRRDIHVA
ncbi:MAG: ABC-2 family transporter protein [Methanocella sp. PtaU1.Bin125]|nr:MAG: ABC-2 family transporter protein [Methanocella sp. PtaU1.Bin125]